MSRLKSAYAGLAQGTGSIADATGLLAWLGRHPENSKARWVRSLFAIYDIDAMVRLDLPWWTFRAIDAVDVFLAGKRSPRVFEYGSGASTIWLGRRAGEVISVEHDAAWYPVVAAQAEALPNVQLQLVPPDSARDPDPLYRSAKAGWQNHSFRRYAESIDSAGGDFDIIVIDGRTRVGCLAHAKSRLRPGGMIVFDNSRRARYRAAIAQSGLRSTELSGLAACLPYPDATTLLTR